jgi:hypothetical protein
MQVDSHDEDFSTPDLISHRSQASGVDDVTPLLAVSRSGMRVASLTALGPQEFLDA